MVVDYDTYTPSEMNKHPYLDNKLGITNIQEFLEVEYKISSLKAFDLISTGKLKRMPMEFETLIKIHKYLFSDIYPWAGELRVVDISKGDSKFCKSEFLRTSIQDLTLSLKKDNNLLNLNEEEFVELFSYYSNELNALHPFREGNGRSRRIFMTELARRAGYEIDLDKLDASALREADIDAFNGNMLKMKMLFLKNIKPIKEQTIEQPKTFAEKVNKFLWIFDREEYASWQRMNDSFNLGVLKVKELMKTTEGKQKLVKYLTRAQNGIKTKHARETSQKYIDAITKTFSQDGGKEM